MTMYRKLLVAALCSLSLQACSSFIYRIDIPQGNYLEQKDVNKLRVDMTKEQVVFVLGRPVVKDSFDHDTWYYVYNMKRGMAGTDFRKDLILKFDQDKLQSLSGDFDTPEDFATSLE